MRYRVGNGFDVHVLVPDRPLILGGIEIPHNKGLKGHSDGDCVVHSLIEALLGAAGEGDIGTLYPPDKPDIAGISSLTMLDVVYGMIEQKGYLLENADFSVICEEPKLKPHYQAMQQTLCNRLRVMPDQINVKARTAEKLGPIGAGEAIASICTVLLTRL